MAFYRPPYHTIAPCRCPSSPGLVQTLPCCNTATVSCFTCPSPPWPHRDKSLHLITQLPGNLGHTYGNSGVMYLECISCKSLICFIYSEGGNFHEMLIFGVHISLSVNIFTADSPRTGPQPLTQPGPQPPATALLHLSPLH